MMKENGRKMGALFLLLLTSVIHVYLANVSNIYRGGKLIRTNTNAASSVAIIPDLSNATVLITGIAGFIGYSVASQMARLNITRVVGIDNFNSYYDPALKYARADMLSHYDSVTVMRGDVCNASLIQELFDQHNFTHVIHLAAQAGVRYSLERPLEYVRANIECFVTLFEQLRRLKSTRRVPIVVYASSSSVYGANTKIPFEEGDRVDRPSSLYGATKRMNELLAWVYFHVFGVASIGLRFFTVYGPWGRPDMAPFVFTQKIEKGEPITVYNHGNMKRDFTYIDDIVSGIVRSAQIVPSSPMVLNLGNERPESVLTLINIIEENLQQKAKITFETSVVDLPLTFASTERAREILGYQAQTTLKEGMQRFIDWYLLHSQARFLCASECADPARCIPTFFDAAVLESVKLTDGCDTVVYTVFFGTNNAILYEPLQELHSDRRHSSCYLAFTSQRIKTEASSSKWHQIILNATSLLHWDSRRVSRVLKLAPGRFFASTVKYAIYLDAKYQLLGDPRLVVNTLTNSSGNLKALMAGIRHPACKNSFGEREAIARAKRKRNDVSYSMWLMDHQINLYREMERGYNVSMVNAIHGAFIIHDVQSQAGRDFRCAWSKEYFMGPDRDQLSFPWILAKRAKDIGMSLFPDQEWCQVQKQPDYYVRILPHSFLDKNAKYHK